jgi:predicted PurR-regulated permease PerM
LWEIIMSGADSSQVDNKFLANAMASFIQIGALLLLLTWCYTIVSPFLNIVIWALIISVAIYPVHQSLSAKLGGRTKLSSTILVLIGMSIIIIPTWLLAESSISGLRNASAALESGEVMVPPPNESVADWPLIGERTYAIWSGAAKNLEGTLKKYNSQLQKLGQGIAGFAGGTLAAALGFVVSTIIAGVLLMNASGGHLAARNIAASFVGTDGGDSLVDLSILTVRSVVKGVLGVAVIQAILSAIGLVAIGVPAAGLWAGAILVLAIIQLPPLLILGPIAVWVFSTADPVPATIFLVYALVVSASDAFLKPMLLGRGLSTPMLVILIGAIGGAMASGVMGLFIGAVILALGYELLVAWMAPDENNEETAEA